VFAAAVNTVVSTIRFGTNPRGVAVTPDGRLIPYGLGMVRCSGC